MKRQNVAEFTRHAQERMLERDIADVDVFRVLRAGYIDDEATPVQYGNWQYKVTLKIKGGRVAGVGAIILMKAKLRIRTVEWEDPR